MRALAPAAPASNNWLHEIKYDGYRKHARLDRDKIRLLTRTGLHWVASLSAHHRSAPFPAGEELDGVDGA
jgi:ATP-dependent DNA ligase